ncbi:isochorismate synthase [Photorhabdus temperata]|uniref:isochorismate synthase n=2 Tax=Photorhabdus khanii TaxID=1004150 RepID=W3V1R8_9GAMM|nr:isochorismate synthase [Photorhabdus khanii]ETS29758.1 isochorismate synthase [Photorhabdus khanii NC19]MQL48840.1 isochorismate synthase [Photorhabdus khanii]OHV50226.1 isochorismate synthase [Photorhabdus temperata]
MPDLYRNTLLTGFNDLNNKDFLFLSSSKSLLAQGQYAIVSKPLDDAANPDSLIQQEIRQLFQQAKRDGIENPVLVGAIPFDKQQNAALFVPEQCNWFQRKQFPTLISNSTYTEKRRTQWPDKAHFSQMVNTAVDAMRNHRLDKIVLSRLLDIETHQPLDSIQLLRHLNQQNSWSYNFHVPLQNGALIGASPELLVRKQGNTIFSQPLAGSAKRSENQQEDYKLRQALIQSVKDNYEHRLVTDMMRNVLESRCQKLHISEMPSTISTPVLWHLATDIEGELKAPQENALSIACLLHPTPALCGTPYQTAKNLIEELEPFKRNLFGGIVGWCDEKGNGEWVVTIRCGEVNGSRVRLFAGAGIVPDSKPESEWQETEVKFSTMMRAFEFSQEACPA